MSTVSYCILSVRYFEIECHLIPLMNTNINISTTEHGNVWCGSRFRSVNRHSSLMLQCYAEFICESSTIIFKVKPGCAWILSKLVSEKWTASTLTMYTLSLWNFSKELVWLNRPWTISMYSFTSGAICLSQFSYCPVMTGQVLYNFSQFRAMNTH